jgi:hypothetical protein
MFNTRISGGVLLILAAAAPLALWFAPASNDQDWLDLLNATKGPSHGVHGRQRFVVDLSERYRPTNGTLESNEWTLRVLDDAGSTAQTYRRTVYYEGRAVKVVMETPWRKTTAPLASELASPGPEEVLFDNTPASARPAIRVAAYGLSAALGLGGILLLVLPRRKHGGRPVPAVTDQKQATDERHTQAEQGDSAEEFIRFRCPACGKMLKARSDQAGKCVRCSGRGCSQAMEVPLKGDKGTA